MSANPQSAQPMPGLSKRAQQMLKPVRPGFCTPIPKAFKGEIPKALRSKG
jgi:hypothetical protein